MQYSVERATSTVTCQSALCILIVCSLALSAACSLSGCWLFSLSTCHDSHLRSPRNVNKTCACECLNIDVCGSRFIVYTSLRRLTCAYLARTPRTVLRARLLPMQRRCKGDGRESAPPELLAELPQAEQRQTQPVTRARCLEGREQLAVDARPRRGSADGR